MTLDRIILSYNFNEINYGCIFSALSRAFRQQLEMQVFRDGYVIEFPDDRLFLTS